MDTHSIVFGAFLDWNQEGVAVSDKIDGLLLRPLSAGFSSEHIMAMSLRLKGLECQPGATDISPSHSIKPGIN